MFSVHGDVEFADRAERIAFNAQPATWSSPRGGDMWAHQYLQAGRLWRVGFYGAEHDVVATYSGFVADGA